MPQKNKLRITLDCNFAATRQVAIFLRDEGIDASFGIDYNEGDYGTMIGNRERVSLEEAANGYIGHSSREGYRKRIYGQWCEIPVEERSLFELRFKGIYKFVINDE